MGDHLRWQLNRDPLAGKRTLREQHAERAARIADWEQHLTQLLGLVEQVGQRVLLDLPLEERRRCVQVLAVRVTRRARGTDPRFLVSFRVEDTPSVREVLGAHPLVTWSSPIIQGGLVYVVDVQNGLYVLRYTGPWAEEVSSTRFLEGNSNS